MDNNICIVTGPIGSGKSFLFGLLKENVFKILDLDIVSKEILRSDEGRIFLENNFSDTFLNGIFNKGLLAKEVFLNKRKLEILENFIHPKVSEYINIWKNDLSTYGVIEVSAPKSLYQNYKTIVLNSPKELRIERLISRGMEIDDINRRIVIQKSQEWWNKLGQNIENINVEDLKKNIESLLREWEWINE